MYNKTINLKTNTYNKQIINKEFLIKIINKITRIKLTLFINKRNNILLQRLINLKILININIQIVIINNKNIVKISVKILILLIIINKLI